VKIILDNFFSSKREKNENEGKGKDIACSMFILREQYILMIFSQINQKQELASSLSGSGLAEDISIVSKHYEYQHPSNRVIDLD
jgi:hypothetical protein